MAGTGFQFSPGAFRTKDADPEGTLEMFERYCESMTRDFRLNRRTNPTTGARVEFNNTDKKDIIQLEGGVDMQDLFKHVGKVLDGDTYQEAINKITDALKKRGNWSAAVFKLFTRMTKGARPSRASGGCGRRNGDSWIHGRRAVVKRDKRLRVRAESWRRLSL